MKVFSKIIRIITIPQVAAVFVVTLLYLFADNIFLNIYHYIIACFTLGVFPILAYPISLIKPKEKRRKFQRSLSIILCVGGYLAGFIYSVASKTYKAEIIIYMTYMLSGIITAVCSFIFKYKTSGHTCGISGPCALLVYYISPYFIFSFILLIPVFLSSLKLKRHTLSQLTIGSFIPILCLIVSIYAVNII